MGYSSITHAIIWYVESHLMRETMEAKEIESQIGFSYAYIRELFRNNTGYSLGKYVRMRKIWLSAFDLVHTNKSILEIAITYGFSSQESYTRAFEKVTKMTPGQFRKEKPVIGKTELMVGVFGIGFLCEKEKRSDIRMNNCERYESNESTILFEVPKVGYGTYGGQTPYPICLKACSDYLGENVEYFHSMVTSGAAFRFAWNEKQWDMSNVDIFHTFEETNEIYQVGAKALGREFDMLMRNEKTTKGEFISFIKKHIDEGYPCIALGIIGPPEACLITGYREKGDVLLGWNFFQNDPDFSANVKTDECGYFVCDNWWENTDTQAVMCMGAIIDSPISQKEILENGIHALNGRRENDYCKGVLAYEAWEKMLLDESEFSVGDNFSVLFEKLLCQNDAITCLRDGRGQAAKYFDQLKKEETDPVKKESWNHLTRLFSQIEKEMEKLREMFGDWSQVDNMLRNLASSKMRKEACRYIERAYEADKKALAVLREIAGQ